LALGRETLALGVGEPDWLTAELLSQHAVLLHEVFDHLELVAVDPTGEDQHQEPNGLDRHRRTIAGSIVFWHSTRSRC
jgi:hypothetical protein